jgi:hypothetical protein
MFEELGFELTLRLKVMLHSFLYFNSGMNSVHKFLKEITKHIFLLSLNIVKHLIPPFHNVCICEISVAGKKRLASLLSTVRCCHKILCSLMGQFIFFLSTLNSKFLFYPAACSTYCLCKNELKHTFLTPKYNKILSMFLSLIFLKFQ